jgi:hypothetical protein
MTEWPDQSLTEIIRGTDVLFWTVATAPAALRVAFSRLPEDGVIALMSEDRDVRSHEELEYILLHSTTWHMLQRVLLENRTIALLFVPR